MLYEGIWTLSLMRMALAFFTPRLDYILDLMVFLADLSDFSNIESLLDVNSLCGHIKYFNISSRHALKFGKKYFKILSRHTM